MLAYEVFIDGAKLCTAGAGDYGVLSVILTWVRRPGRENEDPPDPMCEVRGIAIDDAAGMDTHLSWLGQPVPIGSELRVRVLEATDVDPAPHRTSTPRTSPVSLEEHERRLYQRLKAKFEPEGGASDT